MITRTLSAFILAVLASYLAAVTLVTQFNIARISEMSISVTLQDRISTTLSDLAGMYSYIALIAIGLAIAFCFAHLLVNRLIKHNCVTYFCVGFIALITIHLCMQWVFNMTPVAATRSFSGLASQGLAGALGGLVYYHFAFRIAQGA